jgi:hypothetical protein
METCKTAERNLKKVLYLFGRDIKQSNVLIVILVLNAIKKRFLGGAIVDLDWRNYYVKFKYNIRIQTLFGIMSSVLYILLLTSVVIIFFVCRRRGTDYALIGIKII